ncbi:MAG: MlaD family protein [Gemmatimonadota bacterium]
MSRRASPRVIGAFVVAGIGLAVASVAIFGSGPLFPNTYPFVAFFDSGVGGLGPGSPVKFRGVTVGSVEAVFLRIAEVQQEPDDASIPVIFNINADLIAGRGATLDLSNPASLDSLIDLGMAASLGTESLVTGRQYVALDMYPDRERRLVGTEGTDLIEIPTVRTGFEEIQEKMQDVISNVAALDLEGLFEDVRGVVTSLREQIEGGDLENLKERATTALEGLDLTLAEFREFLSTADSLLVPIASDMGESVSLLRNVATEVDSTLATLRGAVEPRGRLAYRLDVALKDLADAARSFRNLADYLERNPSALIRGRPEDKE